VPKTTSDMTPPIIAIITEIGNFEEGPGVYSELGGAATLGTVVLGTVALGIVAIGAVTLAAVTPGAVIPGAITGGSGTGGSGTGGSGTGGSGANSTVCPDCTGTLLTGAATGEPQIAQNLVPSSSSCPQPEQCFTSVTSSIFDPQLAQNASFSVPSAPHPIHTVLFITRSTPYRLF